MTIQTTIQDSQTPAPRWLSIWAWMTVLLTACLLALGGIVTTFRVGMADPIWPTTPWYLFFISWQEPSRGFLIEHTHRLAGYIVGCLVIVLTVGLGFSRTTRTLKVLGIVALLAVILQGLLGGFRVVLHDLVGTDLAAVHGCFAQVVFCLLVVLAALTGKPTSVTRDFPLITARQLRTLALLLTATIFLQLVWGALLRHHGSPLAHRLHLLTAFAVVGGTLWFTRAAASTPVLWSALRFPLLTLGILLAFQVVLGVESWLGKFLGVAIPELRRLTAPQAALRTGHLLIGSWILANATLMALRLHRMVVSSSDQPRDQATQLDDSPAGPEFTGAGVGDSGFSSPLAPPTQTTSVY